MAEIRRPGDILVVSVGEKSCRSIAGLIDRSLYDRIIDVHTGAEARRLLPKRSFSLVVINAPLSDEFGHELASDVAEHYTCGVVLLTKSDVIDEVNALVQSAGVITVPKPVSRSAFEQAVRVGLSESIRLLAWEQEISRLKRKLEEARLVGRAKCMLVEQRGYSEAEAHRHIEKKAMDCRVSLRDIAEEIIRESE